MVECGAIFPNPAFNWCLQPCLPGATSGGGGGAPPFSDPSSVANLVVWLDALNNGTTGSPDVEVDVWSDMSGNDNHFGSTSFAAAPIYKESEINGLPAIRFDGSDDEMTATIELQSYSTLFVVTKWSGSGRTFMIEHGANVNSNPGFFFAGFDGFVWGVRRASLNSDDGPTGGGAQYTGTGWRTLAFRYSASPSYRMDGVVQTPGAISGINVGDSAVSANLNIGSRIPGSFGHSSCDIAELLVYNRALTDLEVTDIEGWLRDKYAHY